ncbi:MAG: hypothetical protein ACI4DP_09280, partial [Candidatus Ornithomonoglobus sp.]
DIYREGVQQNLRFATAPLLCTLYYFPLTVKISPIKLSATIIASVVALRGADSLGTSAALILIFFSG